MSRSLRRLLFARLDGHVMGDRAAGDGAENRVMVCIVTGNRADDGTLQTSGLRRRCQRHSK